MDSDAEAEEIASDEDDIKVGGDEDEDAYSVDFEDDFQTSPVKPPPKPAAPIPAKKVNPPVIPAAKPVVVVEDEEPNYDDDFENEDEGGYDDASFENESRTSSPRHHVNLSVPTRPPSPPRALVKAPEVSTSPLPRIDETKPEFQLSRQAEGTNQYIRQLENQIVEENDQLKHQHAQLTRANVDLKNELRFLQQRHLDEKRLRSEKFQQKKKRADERRIQHELLLQTTKQTLSDVEAKYIALDSAMSKLSDDHKLVIEKLSLCEDAKHVIEERHSQLSDKYQLALQDIHTIAQKLEAAVDARQQTQQKYEQAILDHRVAIEVTEQKCLVKLQCMQDAMEKLTAERNQERVALPENYRLIVEAQRERYEKMEIKLLEDKREMEEKANRERERYEKALGLANTLRLQAEERADVKIRDEAIKVFRERDSIDDQRRQLLTSLATQNARLDEERGKLDALRYQLEEKRLKLVQDEITVEAQNIINTRKREVLALSTTAMEKSKQYSEVVERLERLQISHDELQLKYDTLSRQTKDQQTDQEHKWQVVEREKLVLERTNAALQHEKLQLAKQKMECRQLMEGTRKLDYLLRQQAALGNIYVHPPTQQKMNIPWIPPPSWNIAFDADKEASIY